MMKRVIAALALSLVLAGCGPSDYEREKLAFEEKKYNDEQAAKAEAAKQEAEAAEREKTNWLMCRADAEQAYNNDFKYWGEPVPGKSGVRNGPIAQMEDMKNRLQRKQEECDRNFPKGINY
jgi:hypothetical protein